MCPYRSNVIAIDAGPSSVLIVLAMAAAMSSDAYVCRLVGRQRGGRSCACFRACSSSAACHAFALRTNHGAFPPTFRRTPLPSLQRRLRRNGPAVDARLRPVDIRDRNALALASPSPSPPAPREPPSAFLRVPGRTLPATPSPTTGRATESAYRLELDGHHSIRRSASPRSPYRGFLRAGRPTRSSRCVAGSQPSKAAKLQQLAIDPGSSYPSTAAGRARSMWRRSGRSGSIRRGRERLSAPMDVDVTAPDTSRADLPVDDTTTGTLVVERASEASAPVDPASGSDRPSVRLVVTGGRPPAANPGARRGRRW
jgi:hypothetical protein